MEIILTLLLLLIAGAAVWRAYSTSKRAAQLQRQIAENAVASERISAERDHLKASLATATSQIDALQERVNDLMTDLSAERQISARQAETIRRAALEQEERERLLEDRFRNLANDILRQNSAEFKQQNEERLGEILRPLNANIEEFKKTVSDTYNTEARERHSLADKIADLVKANNTVQREAHELALALKGNNRMQGAWGEMVLETILEKSGLRKGHEYFVQMSTDADGKSVRDDSGKLLRPDVVVNYPDGRCVVIDSKVSLTAYMEHIDAPDEETAHQAAMRHVRSVKLHVEELVRKNYQNYVGSDVKLDFAMMFIPNEPAYIMVMRYAPELWQEAYDRRVLIVSPTHLVSSLRIIEQLWSRDKVTKNAIKIAEDAGKMYDKFVDFINDMEKIERAITSTQKSYTDAMTKLTRGTGNLVKRSDDLKKLGIKAAKQLSSALTKDADEDPTEE